LFDAQSLSSGDDAGKRGRVKPLDAVGDDQPRASLPSTLWKQRPYPAREVQKLYHPERRAFINGYAVCGRESGTGGLVKSANEWPWSSHIERFYKSESALIDDIPMELPANWGRYVDEPLTGKEMELLRESVNRQLP